MSFDANLAHRHWKLFVPAQAAGANLVYFDLFNASGSALDVELGAIVPIVSGANAVVGAVSVDLFLTRTSAVGTGGTAATNEGTSLTACTFSAQNSPLQGAISSSITARLTPTGGATAGAVLNWCSLFTEETSAAPYYAHTNELVRRGLLDAPWVKVPEGTGIRVVQGSVASVGNIGFDVLFRTLRKA